MKLLILICLTLCLAACKAQEPCPIQLTCPTYWTRHGKSCYRTFGLPQPFLRASEVCQLFTSCGSAGPGFGQGHLVSINSDEENQFLFSFLAGRYGEIPPSPSWLGLSDVDPLTGNQGEFRWADGTFPGPATFSAWDPNFPQQNAGMNCAIYSEQIQPRWMDMSCEEELPYICELSASVSGCSGDNTPAFGNPAAPVPVLTNPNKPKRYSYAGNPNRAEPV